MLNLNKTLKRTAALLALLSLFSILAASMVSCNRTKEGGTSVILYSCSDGSGASLKRELEEGLSNLGLKYGVADAGGLENTMLAEVDMAISKGAKTLAVEIGAGASDEAVSKVIEKAKAADANLILLGGNVNEQAIAGYDKCFYLGLDYESAGHSLGRLMGNYIVDNYDAIDLNGDGKIQYVMIRDEVSSEEEASYLYAISECNSILEENGFPPISFYDEKTSAGYLVTEAGRTAADLMKGLLSKFNEKSRTMPELAIGGNGGISMDILSALEDIGFNRSSDKSIPVFSFESSEDISDRIDKGSVTAAVSHSAKDFSDTLIKISENLAGGKDALDGIDKDLTKGSRRVYIKSPLYPEMKDEK